MATSTTSFEDSDGTHENVSNDVSCSEWEISGSEEDDLQFEDRTDDILEKGSAKATTSKQVSYYY